MSVGIFSAGVDPARGTAALTSTRRALRSWLEEAGMPEPQLHEILIAAAEACSNAVEHSGAKSSDADPAVCIRATCDDQQVRVVVSDRGRWRQPRPSRRTGRRGRGRIMMSGLSDGMQIHTGPTGTTVELIKKRPILRGAGTWLAPGRDRLN